MEFKKVDFSSPKSLYLQVTETIEKKILNGELEVGERLPPQRDLRKIFNVSINTMGEAISSLVREGYLATRSTHGTFVISAEPKKNLTLERRNEISLVVCPFESVKGINYKKRDARLFLDEFFRGVEGEARKRNAYIMYSTIKDDKLTIAGKEKDIAGLIITGIITPKIFKTVKRSKIPFVLIGDIFQKTPPGEDVDIIASDDIGSAYMATKHLTELGHKRIVYITHSELGVYWEKNIIDGYKKALKEAGVPFDNNLVVEIERNTDSNGYKEMKEFMEKSIPFTGVVHFYEHISKGIVKALAEKKLRVPEDISLVGIGDLTEFTCVTCEREEIGRAAAERLFEKISNPDSKPRRIIIPHHIIVCKSTRKIENT
jgi:LacI family transcriptional regulator